MKCKHCGESLTDLQYKISDLCDRCNIRHTRVMKSIPARKRIDSRNQYNIGAIKRAIKFNKEHPDIIE